MGSKSPFSRAAHAAICERLDDENGTLDWSFLIAGTFDLDRDERDDLDDDDERTKEHTRWVSFGIVDNGGTGVQAAPAALDVMEQNGAHDDDVARLRAAYQGVCDAPWAWDAVESESEPGRVWYHNSITGDKTWEAPAQTFEEYLATGS